MNMLTILKIFLILNFNIIFYNLRHIQNFIAKNTKINTCDHFFFIHTYQMGRILGLAFLNKICSEKESASSTLFINIPEIVMAHELGHNLAAHHDTDSNVNKIILLSIDRNVIIFLDFFKYFSTTSDLKTSKTSRLFENVHNEQKNIYLKIVNFKQLSL